VIEDRSFSDVQTSAFTSECVWSSSRVKRSERDVRAILILCTAGAHRPSIWLHLHPCCVRGHTAALLISPSPWATSWHRVRRSYSPCYERSYTRGKTVESTGEVLRYAITTPTSSWSSSILAACSVGWWLMTAADLFWEKSNTGWLLVAGLFWEKSTVGTVGWWRIRVLTEHNLMDGWMRKHPPAGAGTCGGWHSRLWSFEVDGRGGHAITVHDLLQSVPIFPRHLPSFPERHCSIRESSWQVGVACTVHSSIASLASFFFVVVVS
jgi:hypothetical protein